VTRKFPDPPRAGPRGWYQSKAGAWWLWTGKISDNTQGLCIRLTTRALSNGPKVLTEKHWFNPRVIRALTSTGVKSAPDNINGLPTAEAVKVAEDAG
jgi:hypothetical protein